MINARPCAPDSAGTECALHHPDQERHRLRHLLLIGAHTSDGQAAAGYPSGSRRWMLSTSRPSTDGEELAAADGFISYLLGRPAALDQDLVAFRSQSITQC
ncbi:hypothetical protein ACIBF1_19510 [Spirillospora sp. NPDC050679]